MTDRALNRLTIAGWTALATLGALIGWLANTSRELRS